MAHAISDPTTAGCPYGHDKACPVAEPVESTRWPEGKAWDGAPGVWPRPTTRYPEEPIRPAQFISSAPDEFLDCDSSRIDLCYEDFLCTVCGDSIKESAYGWGWLLGKSIIGGACCTRCAYLSAYACPTLSEIRDEKLPLWRLRSKRGYRWADEKNKAEVGTVVPTPTAKASSFAALTRAVKKLRAAS